MGPDLFLSGIGQVASLWSSVCFTGKEYHNLPEILYLLFSLLNPENNNILQK